VGHENYDEHESERQRLVNAILGTRVGSLMERDLLESSMDNLELQRLYGKIKDISLKPDDSFYNDHY
jgi:hypothetical protein